MRLRLTAGILALAAALPAAASAAPPVLGPTAAGARLTLSAEGSAICSRLELGRAGGETCGPPPLRAEDGLVGVVRSRGNTAVGGVVPASVAAVEVEYPSGARVRVATSPGSYRGRLAGRIRFFLADRPGGSTAWLVRLLDAGGAVSGAVEIDSLELARAPLARSARGDWRLSARAVRGLAPVPGDLARTEDAPCLELRHRETTTTNCLPAEPGVWPLVDGLTQDVEARGRRSFLEWGFLSPAARRLRVTLGSGRRVPVPARRLPARLGSAARWYVWTVPSRSAVRRVEVIGRDGRVLARPEVASQPASARGPGGLAPQTPVVARTPAVLEAGPLRRDPPARLLLRRAGVWLCAEIARPDPREPSCGLAPVSAAAPIVAARGTRRGDSVGGVVASEVATVELRPSLPSSRGRPPGVVRVPTRPAGAAAGPFAGQVRTFLATLPYSGLVDVRLLGADGQELERFDVFASYRTTTARDSSYRRLLSGRVPGGGRYVLGADEDDGECLALLAPGGPRRPGAAAYSCFVERVTALAPCRPRMVALLVRARGRADLVALTGAGRTIAGRRVRAGERSLWLVVAPRRAGLRELRWRDRSGATRRLQLGELPAASRQCGYTVER